MKSGTLVMLTDEGLEMLPRYRGKTGKVFEVYGNGKYATVDWEHLKKRQTFATKLLDEILRRPQQPDTK